MITTEEYLKIYYSDKEQDIKLRKEYNKNLLEKYPWLTPHNVWTGEIPKNFDYERTWADNIPDGWRLAFGDQMIEELDQLLKRYNIEKEYYLMQIKEKYGGLRWYDNGFPKEGYEEYKDWLYKYEELSFKTCINCGKPAIGYTKGWISPLCKECMKDQEYDPIEGIDEEAN